mgnify:CR=1 FL=1
MKAFKISALIIALAIVLVACKPINPDAKPTDQLDDIRTVAARTIEALTTQMLQTEQANKTLAPHMPSETLETPIQPVETAQVPTNEAETTPAPNAGSQPDGKPCDLAFFMGETIPDGSELYPGMMFKKTWTFRNDGSCTWTGDYAVVFMSGDSMSAPVATPIGKAEVKPGETVEVTVPLIAPTIGGEYRADFKLRNAGGVLFAFKNPDHTFWVDIKVVEGVIHLAHAYCGATWSSAAGVLPCPGLPSDPAGYVYSDNSPVLETGAMDDEPTLWLGVNAVQNGYIMGIYPAMKIPENASFSTVLGCGHGLTQCRVNFVLAYQEGEGQVVQLGSWDEVYDGELERIRLDLSALAGRTVKIVLIARAIDSPDGGRIHLLEPVIKP